MLLSSRRSRLPETSAKDMVRPRFAKLPQQQQRWILQAALDEFAAKGFHDASLNQVIEKAGISKGSMYYYFDGKEDLYAYVTHSELQRLFASLGPLPVPYCGDSDTFWSAMEDYYLRLMTALTAAPKLADLIRGWIAAPKNPTLQQAQQAMEQSALPWVNQALAIGQRLGAVRSDLPSTLLIAVVVGMGQAMDTWLLTQTQGHHEDLPEMIGSMIDLIRRAVQP